MADLTVITGAAWATSGAATAGSTGFTTATGLTHAPHTLPIPPGCTAAGVLTGADDAAITFRVGPTSESFGSLGTRYRVKFNIAAVRTATPLAADSTMVSWGGFTNAGTKFRQDWRVRNNAIAPGLMVDSINYSGTGTRTALSTTQAGSLASGSFPFGSFQEIALEMSRDSSGAEGLLYHAGIAIVRHSALDMETVLGQTNLRNGFTLTFPATAGIRWVLTGTIKTSDGNASNEILPRWDFAAANAWIAQYHLAAWVDAANGCMWDSTGSLTWTPDHISTGGANAFRKIFTAAGSNGASGSISTRQLLGPAPYNDRGVATLLWPMVYVPNGSCSLEVLTSGGSTLIKLDITGGSLTQGATTLDTILGSSRYAVMIHLCVNGQASWSVCDLTLGTNAATKWRSGPLANWTPQSLGRVRVSSTLGANSQQHDGVALCRWVGVAGVDSMAHANGQGVTPLLAVRNHITANLPFGDDTMTVPGGNYRGLPQGVEPWMFLIIAGTTGQSRDAFRSSVTAGMGSSRGIAVLSVDGGSINNVSVVVTQGDADAMLINLRNLTGLQFDDLLANENMSIMSTMLRREGGATFGGVGSIMNNLIDSISKMFKEMSFSRATTGLIRWTDPAGAIADHGAQFNAGVDQVHPTAAGDTNAATAMLATCVTPPEASLRTRNTFAHRIGRF